MKLFVAAICVPGMTIEWSEAQSVSTKIEGSVFRRIDTCEKALSFIRAYPNGSYRSRAEERKTELCVPSIGQPVAPAPQPTLDPCYRARVDWAAIEEMEDIEILKIFRDNTPTDCPIQRALADAKLAKLNQSAPK